MTSKGLTLQPWRPSRTGLRRYASTEHSQACSGERVLSKWEIIFSTINVRRHMVHNGIKALSTQHPPPLVSTCLYLLQVPMDDVLGVDELHAFCHSKQNMHDHGLEGWNE